MTRTVFQNSKSCSRPFCCNKGESIDTDSYCLQCTKDLCCMKHMEDSFGRHTCNPLVPLVERTEGFFCLGHWKQRLKSCRYCPSRFAKVNRDGWAYCHTHTPSDDSVLAMLINEMPLPVDLSVDIFRKSLLS